MIPADYRIYQKEQEHKTKNDLFPEMIKKAKLRGFSPGYIRMDAWDGGIDNLKCIRPLNGKLIGNLKSNRTVSRHRIPMAIRDLNLTDKQVSQVWRKALGQVRVCKVVAQNGDITYLATNDLSLTDYDDFVAHFPCRWPMEEFPRALKQTTGIAQCYSLKAQSQRTHLFASFVAFIKMEIRKIKEHITWYEQKASITRTSIMDYLNYSNA